MRRSMMLLTSTGVLVATTALAVLVSACGASDPPPATSPSATAYPQQYPQQQGQYPQQQQGQYPQQQPQQGQYPQQQPQQMPQQAPPAEAQMATPGPLALPCQNDSACGLHRCNVQQQKCAFPCQSPVDCAGGQCMMGVCMPKTQ